MQIIDHLFSFIIAVLILVSIHEFGHFWVARRLGVKVLRFSIGFGRPIYRWLGKDNTEYVIGILPLGGYVKLLDEAEEEILTDKRSRAFTAQPLWKKFSIVIAGPLTNFLFAILAFWLMFVLGVQQIKPVIGKVEPQSIAASAGLKAGQEIIAVNGGETDTWQEVLMKIAKKLGSNGVMEVQTRSPAGAQHQYQLNLAHWKLNSLNPQPIQSLGIIPYSPPISAEMANIEEGSPAANAGLQKGDSVVSIDGRKVKDWLELVAYIQQHPDQEVSLKIKRNGLIKNVKLTLGKRWDGLQPRGYLGAQAKVQPWPEGMKQTRQYSIFSAWLPAAQEVYQLTEFNFVLLGKMLMGEVSLRSLGGPISIFQTANHAFKEGLTIYVGFLGLISVMLGFVNLLPIPGLDGGHLLYYAFELGRGKPLSLRTQALLARLGIIFLIILVVQATMNDILRLFS